MKSNFDRCMDHVFDFEGGYVNHPKDPGGETNMGISKRSYPHEDIRGMTRERAASIYRRDFWDRVKGDELPAGLDLVAFDAAVNSGPTRGARWLQRALGTRDDGKIGPETLRAARTADPVIVIDNAIRIRMAFLKSLPTWSSFGEGWTRRVDSVRDLALQMADKDDAPATPPTKSIWTVLAEILAMIFGGRK